MANPGKMVAEMRAAFRTGRTRNIEWRRNQLKALLQMMEENESKLNSAVFQDLHKHKMEAMVSELNVCRADVVTALNNLSDWTKPQMVQKGLLFKMDTAYIRYEPLGVTLVIGAWNYPVQLTLLPLIGAVAAGNCCILKPSELAESTAQLLEELIPKYMDKECIKVVNGGVPETTALLAERFDLIFYTGNSQVARIVMTAAAKHLTPVVLELGGKSPVFVDSGVNMDTVVRRLMWGKFLNAGQTCIAPDYVMCTADTQEKLISKLKEVIPQFYSENPKASDSYGRIINTRHFQRVKKLMEGSQVAVGGEVEEAEKYIAPTVLRDCQLSDPVMQEEVFGPLLPIVPVRDYMEAAEIIADREKPLSMYIFSNNSEVVRTLKENTSSGAFVVNDTVVQGGLNTLPFGGVGNSGTGAYHGKFTFDAFSHKRACLEKSLAMESINGLRYPPYTDQKLGWLQWIMVSKPRRGGLLGFFPFLILGAIFAVFLKMIKKPLMSSSREIDGNNI